MCTEGARTGMAWSGLLRWSFVSDVVAADRLAVGRSCLVCACMGFGFGAGDSRAQLFATGVTGGVTARFTPNVLQHALETICHHLANNWPETESALDGRRGRDTW